MKKSIILFLFLLVLSGCYSTASSISIHKEDVHALIQEKNGTCKIKFREANKEKYKDIKTKFSCDKIIYLKDQE